MPPTCSVFECALCGQWHAVSEARLVKFAAAQIEVCEACKAAEPSSYANLKKLWQRYNELRHGPRPTAKGEHGECAVSEEHLLTHVDP